VGLAETVDQSFAMLIDPANQIIRDAHIERTVALAREYVNPESHRAVSPYGLPGQARQ
jgi:hypothetical protein